MSALVFDCDGVLADTERYGHLPAFNQTFEEFGLPVRWSEEEYGRRLEIGGGKERMASLLTEAFVGEAGLPTDPDGQRAEVAAWHKRKTAIYKGMVASGRLPARPGVARVIGEALEAGWPVAVASTSAEESVRAVVRPVPPCRAIGTLVAATMSLTRCASSVGSARYTPWALPIAGAKQSTPVPRTKSTATSSDWRAEASSEPMSSSTPWIPSISPSTWAP